MEQGLDAKLKAVETRFRTEMSLGVTHMKEFDQLVDTLAKNVKYTHERTLGTNPSFPGQNIEGTLAGNAQCTEDILTQNIARKF